MPQSLSQVYLHLIYATKGRHPYLRDTALREELFLYVKGTCDGLNCPSVQTGGWEDHIHILCRFGRTISIADLVKGIKTASSAWIKSKSPGHRDFHWQLGYGTFSVSPADVNVLIDYIQRQEEHHRTETFQDEFRRICQKYGVAIDERYVWD